MQRDRVTGAVVLLYPEGAIELSESAKAVVLLCDGSRTVGEIAVGLSDEFEGVAEEDVVVVIDGLAGRGLVVL